MDVLHAWRRAGPWPSILLVVEGEDDDERLSRSLLCALAHLLVQLQQRGIQGQVFSALQPHLGAYSSH